MSVQEVYFSSVDIKKKAPRIPSVEIQAAKILASLSPCANMQPVGCTLHDDA